MIIKDNVLIKVEEADIVNGTVKIPNNVTSIGRYALAWCIKLKSITIPNSITSIDDSAFSHCRRLTSVTFAANSQLTSIGAWAFQNCRKLTSPFNNYKAFLLKDGKLFAMQNHKKYKLGHKSYARGELRCYENGLHYCTNIFDIFNYYDGEYGKDFVIAVCEVSSENVGHTNDSKRCARWIKPTKILPREEVIKIMNLENVK